MEGIDASIGSFISAARSSSVCKEGSINSRRKASPNPNTRPARLPSDATKRRFGAMGLRGKNAGSITLNISLLSLESARAAMFESDLFTESRV